MKPIVSCPLSWDFIGLLTHLAKDAIAVGEHYFVRRSDHSVGLAFFTCSKFLVLFILKESMTLSISEPVLQRL